MRFEEHPIEWDDEKVARLWDYYSRTPPYSEMYFAKDFGDRILKMSRLPLRESLSVVDFGCGPGFIWDHLVAMNARWSYTAVDFSAESVDSVLKKASGHPLFKSAERVSELPTGLPGSAYDVLLLLEVVEHLRDEHLASTLQEVSRLLKRGGALVVTTPNNEDLSRSTKFCPECGAIFHEWQHVRSWSVSSLSEQLGAYGFDLRMAKTLDFSAKTILQKGIRLMRRLLGRAVNPHMIAVFQKR